MMFRFVSAIAAACLLLTTGANAQGKVELQWFAQSVFKLTTARSKEMPKLRNILDVTTGLAISRMRDSFFIRFGLSRRLGRSLYNTLRAGLETRPVGARAEPKLTRKREDIPEEFQELLQFPGAIGDTRLLIH